MWLAHFSFLICKMRITTYPLKYKCKESMRKYIFHKVTSVQSLSCVSLFVTPWTAAHQASLSISNSQSLLKLSDAIQPSHTLSLPSPPVFYLSQHQGLSNESVLCIRWAKYWSFSFSISPTNEYSGLISFRVDWKWRISWISLQFKVLSRVLSKTTFQSINSLVLSFLYSLTLTSIHDYWKHHSFD